MTDSHDSPHRCPRRRFLLGMAAVVIGGCSSAGRALNHRSLTGGDSASPQGPSTTLAPVPPPNPGPPHTVFSGPTASGAVALTFDDGYCQPCVANLVAAVERTGARVTFSPNGAYRSVWNRHADQIKEMVKSGQVAMINHTWSHQNPVKMSAAQLRSELERNDEWIHEHFGTTSRPFYRPPFGYHNRATDELVGSIGYTNIVMWNGTFGDAVPHPPAFLVDQMRKYAKPGTIMLGHGNHLPTSEIFDQILAVVKEANLRPVTLPELLGVRLH